MHPNIAEMLRLFLPGALRDYADSRYRKAEYIYENREQHGTRLFYMTLANFYRDVANMLEVGAFQNYRKTCPPNCDHKWNPDCSLSCYEDGE